MYCSQRSKKNQVLSNAFSTWKEGTALFPYLTEAPWSGADIQTVALDLEYFGNHSGMKYLSPLLYHYLDANGVITDEGKSALVSIIKSIYYPNWHKLWASYIAEFEPASNYNLKEVGKKNTETDNTGTVDDVQTLNSSESNKGSTTLAKTGTVTDAETLNTKNERTQAETTEVSVDGTTTTTHGHIIDTISNASSETNDYTFGFNSGENGVNSAKSTTGSDNTSKETNSGNDVVKTVSTSNEKHDNKDTVENTGTDTTLRTLDTSDVSNEEYTKTNTGTDTRLKTLNTKNAGQEEYEWTRTGTAQASPSELIAQYRELWLEPFFSRVFDDLDKLLTLGVYAEREPTKIYF